MSDLHELRHKVESGAQWRGDITVSVDGEPHELTVRQLRDPEFWEVMSMVDIDEIEAVQEAIPEDKLEELDDLEEADDLDEAEEERLAALREEIEGDINLFDLISKETYEGIRLAAVYGVEPDKGDIRDALREHPDEIEAEYGRTTSEAAKKYLKSEVVEPMFEQSTDFTSFNVGIKVLTETMGDAKN